LRQERVTSDHQTTPIRFHHSVVPGPGLEIGLEFAPRIMVCRLAGHLRTEARAHLKATFRSALGQRPERLVIDTSGLITCDAAGLAALVESLDEPAGSDELPVAVTALTSVYQQMLHLVASRQERTIMTFPTVDEAITRLLSSPGAPRPDPDTLLIEVRNLHRAMLTRGSIDQAKGVLMAVYGLDSDAAFSMLVWYSRSSGLPLRDLAARFLTALRDDRSGPLTVVRTDALLSDLAYRSPQAGGRYA
jgi:ABC-type transporter Mla MlaB component